MCNLRYLRSARLALVLAFLGGCSTFVESEKSTPSSKGIRYWLPITFLEVIPQMDGTIAVTPQYLADRNNEYVLRTNSLLSAYTLDVKRASNGLLEEVSLNQNGTALGEATASAAGTIAKARFDAEAKIADDRAKKIEDTRNVVADAETEVQQAKAKLNKLRELANEDEFKDTVKATDLLAAELAVASAEAKHDALRAEGARRGLGEFSIPGGGGDTKQPRAWGPVLFQVVQDAATGVVSLRAVAMPCDDGAGAGQCEFKTSTVAQPAKPEAGDVSFRMSVVGSSEIACSPLGGKCPAIDLKVDPEFKGLDKDNSGLAEVARPAVILQNTFPVLLTPQPDRKTILVNLNENTPAGNYFLQVSLVGPSGEPQAQQVEIRVRR